MILKFIINKPMEWRILLKFNSIYKSLAFKILIFFILIYFLFTVNQGFTIDSLDENSKINKRREKKLAQTSQIQNQDQRIEELERKLNLITEELKQLKSLSDLPDSRLELIGNFEYEKKINQHFGIAVAGYPEKHLEALSFDADISNLKRKVNAGANLVITQLFYDNRHYYKFVEKVRDSGLDVPIVPGLMPILSTKQIKKITSMCGSQIPTELSVELEKAGDNDELAREIGTEQCIGQCKELLKSGVPGIHFYVLNKSQHIQKIIKSLPV